MRNPGIPLALCLSLFLTFTVGYASTDPDAESALTPEVIEPVPPVSTTPAITKGAVIETIDSGDYTYVYIENEGMRRWAAMPMTKVEVGQEVELAAGTEMGHYISKTLGRAFDSIYFCGGLVNTPATMPHPIPTVSGAAKTANLAVGSHDQGITPGQTMTSASMPPGHGMPAAREMPESIPPAMTIDGKVAEAFDAGGYTYVAIEKDGQTTWVASPPIRVDIGQDVAFRSGFVMNNFTSKSLERTFTAIVFTTGLATTQPVSAEATSAKYKLRACPDIPCEEGPAGRTAGPFGGEQSSEE